MGHTDYISEVPKAMSKARLGPLKGAMSSKKAFQGYETKTAELLEGTVENNNLPNEGSN